MCSDSEKNMSAFADQNHAPSLTCVRLEYVRVISLKPRYANIGANCESTKYEAIRMAFLYVYKRKGVSHVSRL